MITRVDYAEDTTVTNHRGATIERSAARSWMVTCWRIGELDGHLRMASDMREAQQMARRWVETGEL